MAYQIPTYRVSLIRDGEMQVEESEATTAELAARTAQAYIGDTDREHCIVILLNNRHRIIGINTVSIGSVSASLVHPREVFKPAILTSASGVIVAHNHPSGDPEPSSNDVELTKRLNKSGKLIGIESIDHLIVSTNGFESMKRRGVI